MSELISTFGINWKLLVVQAVNFGVLLAALSYLLYTPIMKLLDERRALVEKGVKDAEEAARRLRDAEHEEKEIVGGAAREAETIIARAREHAVAQGAKIETDAKARADGILKEAAERGEAIAAAVVKESDAAVAKAAVLAAEKILAGKQ